MAFLPKGERLLSSPLPYIRGIRKSNAEGKEKPGQYEAHLCTRQYLTYAAVALQFEGLKSSSTIIGEVFRMS
jgi:hypothetical protein